MGRRLYNIALNKIIVLFLSTVLLSLMTSFTKVDSFYHVEKGVIQQSAILDGNVIGVREISSFYDINAYRVKVEVKYAVGSTPPISIEYSDIKNGIMHSGTLNLERVKYKKNELIANYSGYIFPVE